MTDTAKLGIFGHHPEAPIDFCIEVEDLIGYAYDIRTGQNFMRTMKCRSQWPFWCRLSRILAAIKAGTVELDDMARAAIPTVHKLEAYALRRDGGPANALLHEIGA